MKPDCLACVHCHLSYDQSKCDKFYIIPIDHCNNLFFKSRFEKTVINFQDYVKRTDYVKQIDENIRAEITKQIIENTKSF